jgi:hypothetical protein
MMGLKLNQIAMAAVVVATIAVKQTEAQQVLNPMQQQLAQQAKGQERQYKQFMAITMDNIDRICKLTDDQKKKLVIASKGAIERASGKWMKQMVQMQVQFRGGGGLMQGQFQGINNQIRFQNVANAIGEPEALVEIEIAEPVAGGDAADAAADAADVVDVEAVADGGAQIQADVFVADMAMPQMWNGPFGVNSGQVRSVAQETVWTKTLAKVLTEKQKTDLKAAETKRRKFRRKAAVEAVLAKIDSELILSEDQRTKIGALLDKAVGHQFSVQQNGFNQDFSQSNGMTAVQRMPKAQMAKLLSKTQMARWTVFRRQFGAPDQVMPANPLLNWGKVLGGFGLE